MWNRMRRCRCYFSYMVVGIWMAQAMIDSMDRILSLKRQQFWWPFNIDWDRLDFYRLAPRNIREIWHWRTNNWPWNGSTKILADLVVIINASLFLAIVRVKETHHISFSWKPAKVEVFFCLRFSWSKYSILGFAGGASINYQILSAESRKYFHNAIPMSGAVFNFWALFLVKNHLAEAHNIANELGEPKTTFEELVEFLKTVPAEKFKKFAISTPDKGVRFQLLYGPVVESTHLNFHSCF